MKKKKIHPQIVPFAAFLFNSSLLSDNTYKHTHVNVYRLLLLTVIGCEYVSAGQESYLFFP